MSRTPIGFEITDFLNGLSRVGEADPGYDAFVRRYSARRAMEIKQEQAGLTKEVLMQKRKDIIQGIATALLVIAWIFFLALIAHCIGKPVLKEKAFNLSGIISEMRLLRFQILTAVSAALLCFAGHFRHAPSRIVTNVAAILWCSIITLVRFLNSGPFMTETNVAWRTLGVLLVTFIFAIVLGTKGGEWLYNKLLNIDSNERFLTPEKYRFEVGEAVYLIAMMVFCGICLVLFLSMPLFFKAVGTWPFRILTWAFPVVAFIVFCIRQAKCWDGESVSAWICTTLVVGHAAAVLELFTMRDVTRAMIIWAILFAASIGIMIAMAVMQRSEMTILMTFMLLLTTLVSACIVVYSTTAGVDSINISAHWWMVAPSFVMAAGAIATTVWEMVQHKL